MILAHFTFKDLGSFTEGLTMLAAVAASEGCADPNAMTVAGHGGGRLTLCKTFCADNEPRFHLEVGPESNMAHRIVPELAPDAVVPEIAHPRRTKPRQSVRAAT